MAAIFLRSTDGNNGNAGTQKEAAKATLAAALTAAGAGGVVYVSDLSAETQSSAMALASPGTAASPTQVLCVADWGAATGTGTPTTMSTGGSVSTTGSNDITITGFMYCYGVHFSAGSGLTGSSITVTNTASIWMRFDSCHFAIGGTSGGRFNIGSRSTSSNDSLVECINTVFKFAATFQAFVVRCPFAWKGGSVDAAGTIPTSLFSDNTDGNVADVIVEGVDLSALTSGKNLVAQPSTANAGFFRFTNCKLGASVSVSTGTIDGQGGFVIDVVNCDSGDTNYRYAKKVYQGDITSETTIVRTGGASDGTTSISRKLVSTANSKFYSPLEMDPIVIWNESTSSLTVTVHIVTDNVTLTDAECWIEVEELGTSGYPLSVIQSDRAADILATPTNQTTSTETWTTTGLTTPVYQKLHKTFTPAEKGPIKVRVMLAKASTTVYVCPKVEVS